ncbi:unnamed protein product, partial [Amoebophrya sp. A25]|eukprot:GSA25T00028062001.1
MDSIGPQMHWRGVKPGRGKDSHAEILRYLYFPSPDKIIDPRPSIFNHTIPQAVVALRRSEMAKQAARPMSFTEAWTWIVAHEELQTTDFAIADQAVHKARKKAQEEEDQPLDTIWQRYWKWLLKITRKDYEPFL